MTPFALSGEFSFAVLFSSIGIRVGSRFKGSLTMPPFLTICRPRHRHEEIEGRRLISEAVPTKKERTGGAENPTPESTRANEV